MSHKANSMHSSLGLRIIFAGTPDFAKNILDTLVDIGHNIVAVYCQPDRPKGRGRIPTSCPVKETALKHGLVIYQPESLREIDVQSKIKELNADVMVVAAYGQILPIQVLDTPKYGCLNIHASLLPRWRGAAPIQRAILAGDIETGVGIMQMNEGLDTGNILLEKKCSIMDSDNAQTLHDKLSSIGAKAIIEALKDIDKLDSKTQGTDGILYAKKLTKQESWIDWNKSAVEIDRQIRAFNPYPIAQTYASSDKFTNKVLRILSSSVSIGENSDSPGVITKLEKDACRVSTGDGTLNIEKVQIAGKNAVQIKDFNNAYKLTKLS